MERLNEGVYSMFTGLSLITTIVISVYIGYLLWRFIYQRGGVVVVSRRVWWKSVSYINRAKGGVARQISRLPVMRSSKVESHGEFADLSIEGLEEEFMLRVELKSGEVVHLKIDEIQDFLRNNRSEILFDNDKPKELKSPRRSNLAEWEFIDCE